jgi:hypothetical protein
MDLILKYYLQLNNCEFLTRNFEPRKFDVLLSMHAQTRIVLVRSQLFGSGFLWRIRSIFSIKSWQFLFAHNTVSSIYFSESIFFLFPGKIKAKSSLGIRGQQASEVYTSTRGLHQQHCAACRFLARPYRPR